MTRQTVMRYHLLECVIFWYSLVN